MQFEIRNYEDGTRECVLSNVTWKDRIMLILLPKKKEIVFTVEQPLTAEGE